LTDATGADVRPKSAFKPPTPGEIVGSAEVDAAKVGALKSRRAGLHVVVSHPQRKIPSIVVAHPGERVDDDVCGRRRLSGCGRRLGLAGGLLCGQADSRAHGERGDGQRSGETCWETHRFQDYRTAPRPDNATDA